MISGINICCFFTMFCWAYYHAHVADRFLMRVTYAFVCFSTFSFLLITILPVEENSDFRRAFFTANYWQPILPRLGFAVFCVVDMMKEYKTPRFVNAFLNNKIFHDIHYTKN